MIRLPASAPPEVPVLIAGPTASGKSALALAIAEAEGRPVVNADALQVYGGWRLLTARPGTEDIARAPHLLYGHVPIDGEYSVGHWLREVAPLLRLVPAPVIVGGTGLYFTALTEGLADIPASEPGVRAEAGALLAREGLARLLVDLDPDTLARLDRQNPMRVQRAWEVQRQTGRGLADWHRDTGPPLLPLDRTRALLLNAGREWLAERIGRRFDAMLDQGALEEARALLADWDPARLSSQAIGAGELIAVVEGRLSPEAAAEAAKRASRQYAKRQRTWFRRRMGAWQHLDAATADLAALY